MTVKKATELELAIEQIKNGTDPYILIPPYGFVVLRGTYGSDELIAQTARITTNSDNKDPRPLIRHLVRHFHTSPLENTHIDLEVACPIFVERQWGRHRTAGWNEISARYCELPAEQWEVPDERYQFEPDFGENRQGSSSKRLDPQRRRYLKNKLKKFQNSAVLHYKLLREEKIAPEIARIVLPLSTYTRKRWWCDLHNLMHFMKLRMAEDAQKEIRDYADAVYKLLKPIFPITMEAFEDFRLESKQFSKIEIEALKLLFKNDQKSALDLFKSKTEANEFKNKMKNIWEF